MTNTPLVARLDDHICNAALALDVASTALIRAQELAGQDTTGAAPARLATATAMLRGNLRMLADMLTSPHPGATVGCASSHGDDRRRQLSVRPQGTHPPAQGSHAHAPAPAPGQEAPRGKQELHRHLEIADGHGTVASADVTISQGSDHTARASLRAAAGHLPPGVRTHLVDAVLDLPELHGGARLEAVFPLGDSETLHRLRERCSDVTTHPAGTTVLLEANIAPAIPPTLAHKPARHHHPGYDHARRGLTSP
jgi:hypothetical protein